MGQSLRALAEDLSLFLAPVAGSSKLPVTQAPRIQCFLSSMGVCLHAHGVHKFTQVHTGTHVQITMHL